MPTSNPFATAGPLLAAGAKAVREFLRLDDTRFQHIVAAGIRGVILLGFAAICIKVVKFIYPSQRLHRLADEFQNIAPAAFIIWLGKSLMEYFFASEHGTFTPMVFEYLDDGLTVAYSFAALLAALRAYDVGEYVVRAYRWLEQKKWR